MAINQDKRAFFLELGTRITHLRKRNNITLIQLAEILGVAQSTINAYELGQRRVPVSALPLLARTLGRGVEELLGQPISASKRGPVPKLQQQIERLSLLPKAKQKVVIEMLEGVLSQASR